MRIIALSLWERVAEGRVTDPATTRRVPFPAVPNGLLALDTLTPTLSQRERG